MSDPKNTPPSPLLVAKPPSPPDQGNAGSIFGMITEGAEPLEMRNKCTPICGMAMDSMPEQLKGFIDFSEHWDPPTEK